MAELRLMEATCIYPGATDPAVDALDLHVADGELMVLVGPSGCGKSTVLRMVAGLEEVHSGTVLIGDRDVTDTPPKHRDVAMVFQNYALYPYLDVAANMAFPLKMTGVPKAQRARRVQEAAELLGLSDLLARKPYELSGGQRQRVAMGRAIVREPSAFLMDEPLSNLDAKLRVQMRAEIAALQTRLGVTTVYVTHDQVEAMTMGTRVAVMLDGHLQQCAAPRELYERPVNTFVAGFMGTPPMNLCNAPFDDGCARLAGMPVPLADAAAGEATAAGLAEVTVGLRPESLELAPAGIPALVEVVEELGSEAYAFCRAELGNGGTRIAARVDPRRPPANGERVHLRPVEPAHAFHPMGGGRLG